MAKQFYYHGKKKTQSSDGSKDVRTDGNTGGTSGQMQKMQPSQNRPQNQSKKQQNQPAKQQNQGVQDRPQNQKSNKPNQGRRSNGKRPNHTFQVPDGYSQESLNLTAENLGISVATAELLAKNNVNTARDMVCRTERDMFKMQGFNKKMLFELKDALRKHDMAFREEKPQKPTENKKQNERNSFARNEQNGKGKGKNNDRPKEIKTEPEKLTEPLTVENWRKIQKGGKWGFYDGFKTVIPTVYDEVYCFREGLASVEIDEKCGYIDSENNMVIPCEYETAMSFSEGLAAVSKLTKFGYVDRNNTVVIPFEFDAATKFEGGEAKVKKDSKWGTISTDGTIKWI